jgi:hypothetical protein
MPKGLRTLDFSFQDPWLTHFGGLVLLERFCQKLHLRSELQQLKALPRSRHDYRACDLVLALLYVLIAGLRRVSKTQVLQYNGTFTALLGLPRFPDPTTLRRFLQRLSPSAIRQIVRLHDRLRYRLLGLPAAHTTLIFDLDSVVVTLYGHQQGARVGYNPRRKGHRSYHPLLCFEAHRHEFWDGSLRPGNAATNTGAVHFLRRCLAKVPTALARTRVRVRADSGFFGGKLLGWLEQWGCGYVVVAKEYPTLRRRARAAHFVSLAHGWGVAEFRYQAYRWPHARRFVVIRRPLPEDPVEAQQLRLFKDRRYAYQVLVTNLKLHPWRAWRFYVQRSTVEKTIRELLYDLPLSQIPTGEWVANVAYFHLLLLAYNLVHWFKRLCLPAQYRAATVETVRRDFLALPGRLSHPSHRHVLQLPRDYPLRQDFLAAVRKLQKLHLPPKS